MKFDFGGWRYVDEFRRRVESYWHMSKAQVAH